MSTRFPIRDTIHALMMRPGLCTLFGFGAKILFGIPRPGELCWTTQGLKHSYVSFVKGLNEVPPDLTLVAKKKKKREKSKEKKIWVGWFPTPKPRHYARPGLPVATGSGVWVVGEERPLEEFITRWKAGLS